MRIKIGMIKKFFVRMSGDPIDEEYMVVTSKMKTNKTDLETIASCFLIKTPIIAITPIGNIII
jgi:hypothetical protein